MSASSPHPHKTFPDIGKDNALAQWTSEIRKLQTEVDRESEEESRRLQEEIAASRLEREKRRASNRKSGPTTNYGTPVANAVRMREEQSASDMLSIIERQKNQSNALKALVGDSVSSPPIAGPPSIRPTEPISLAAFMGGRATGPRLNKHAPQADAEDPVERPPGAIAAIALPGMQRPFKSSSNPVASPASTPSFAARTFPPPAATPSQHTPPLVTASKPAFNLPAASVTQQPVRQPSPAPVKKRSLTPPRTPTKPTAFSKATSPAAPISSPKPTSPVANRQPTSPPPALARPIQPSASTPSFQLPIGAAKPSPAFLRPLPAKELTPSLTRLQGRGFVAKSVQAGGVDRPASPETPKTPVIPGSPSGKKISVLDRWPGASNSPPISVSPAKPTPKKVPLYGRPPVASPQIPIQVATGPVSRSSSTPSFSAQSTRPEPAATAKPVALPGLSGRHPLSRVSSTDENTTDRVQASSLDSTPTQSATLAHPTRERAKKPKRGSSRTEAKVEPEAKSIPIVKSPALPSPPAEKAAAQAPPLAPKPAHVSSPTPTPAPTQPAAIISPPIIAAKPSSPIYVRPTSVNPIVASPPAPVLDSPKLPISDTSSTVARLADAWGDNKPISARQSPSIKASTPREEEQRSTPSSTIRRALPGLAGQEKTQVAPPAKEFDGPRRSVVDIAQGMRDAQPQEVLVGAMVDEPEEVSTPIDVKSVIANWGRSATKESETPSVVKEPVSPSDAPTEPPEEEARPTDVRSAIASWGRSSTAPAPGAVPPPPSPATPTPRPTTTTNAQQTAIKAERRRSNLHEKYASIILPPLAEEKTPAVTPVGSIVRRETSGSSDVRVLTDEDTDGGTTASELIQNGGDRHRKQPSAFQMHQALLDHKALVDMEGPSPGPSPMPPPVILPAPEPDVMVQLVVEDSSVVHDFDIKAIPPVTQSLMLPADASTISVEVLLVTGNSTTPIGSDSHIFYDDEVRAIVHRVKIKSSGLVTTRVFGWRGRRAEVGAAEAKKLGDLATRFGTSLVPCIQGSEPVELAKVLGGVLITRQGPKGHWSRENTAMHCVREVRKVVYIDQVEPERRNLCSAFSYVSTVLGAVYVFHGRGALPSERTEALKYAKTIASPDAPPTEFEESEEDEMFAMILGDDQHAMADYWRYRNVVEGCLAELYKVDLSSDPIVQRLEEVAAECIDPSAVFVLNGTFELFIIVGADARAQRKDIRLAISVAQQLAALRENKEPFTPPVHILILPSQVPLDVRVGHVRFMDEDLLNGNEIPEHMNLLPLEDALEHLSKTEWPRSQLDDLTFLPLGVAPESIP